MSKKPGILQRTEICAKCKQPKEYRFRAQGYCEKCRAIYDKNYRKVHREQRRNYERKKYETDLQYKLKKIISRAIKHTLNDNKKGRHWEDLVGYTLGQLKKHLERQFTTGMSWENQGNNGWVIDHVIPVSAFNFTQFDHIDFKRCWALKNLQPLWAKDNLEKHTKLTKHFQPSLPI